MLDNRTSMSGRCALAALPSDTVMVFILVTDSKAVADTAPTHMWQTSDDAQ